jgi:uncharacterized glyoxalase superfamily protein PhnB
MPDCAVIPVLTYPGVSAAVAWLTTTFGFRLRWQAENHRAQLAIGDGCVAIHEGGPATPQNAADSIMIRVDDVDAHYEQAVGHGVEIVSPLTTYPYGERQYTAIDLAGRYWTFSGTVEDVQPESWGGRSAQRSSESLGRARTDAMKERGLRSW